MTVYARLAASLLALAAGAVAVVVAVLLLRSVPGPTGSTTAAPAAPAPAAREAPAGGRIATPGNPSFPSPPADAVVVAREAGPDALALAVRPELVRVSVVTGDGRGRSGLDVRVSLGGRAVRAAPCGPGCYQAAVDVGGARSATVTLDGTLYRFALPRLPAPDAAAITAKAGAAWRRLKSLVWHERLASTPTDAINTLFMAEAPDRLRYTIGGGSSAVIIGHERWDSPAPGAPWRYSVQNPPLRQPVPFWDSVVDAHVVATGRYGGKPAWEVSFFDPTSEAWFSAWIQRGSYRTVELNMTAAAHFMLHMYGPFNAPIRLVPPT